MILLVIGDCEIVEAWSADSKEALLRLFQPGFHYPHRDATSILPLLQNWKGFTDQNEYACDLGHVYGGYHLWVLRQGR